MDDLIDIAMPTFITAVSAWIVFEMIGLAWLTKQFRDDMRREDEEQQASREKR